MVERNPETVPDHRPEEVNRNLPISRDSAELATFKRACGLASRRYAGHQFLLAQAVLERADELEWGTPTNIYLVLDARSSAVKIGIAVDVKRRLNSLQHANPNQLELVDWAPGTYALERFLHGWLSEHRIRGEWFTLHHEVLIVCELICSAGDMRRLMDDLDREAAAVDDTVAMLVSPTEWATEDPIQFSLGVTA